MPTAPTIWTPGQTITATAANKAVTATKELQVAAPDMGGRISTLEAGDVLPLYNQTITGVNQGGDDNVLYSTDPNPYHAWPAEGAFTGTATGVLIPTSGKYAITFFTICTSGSFWTGRPDYSLSRVSHWLFTGFDVTKNARAQTAAKILGMSSTDPHGGETAVSVTAVAALTAGDVVTPAWYVNNLWVESGNYHYANPVASCRMTIVRVST